MDLHNPDLIQAIVSRIKNNYHYRMYVRLDSVGKDSVNKDIGTYASGNWGHHGLKGQIGGSSKGGGVQNRGAKLKDGTYNSAAKKRKQAEKEAREKKKAEKGKEAGAEGGTEHNRSSATEREVTQNAVKEEYMRKRQAARDAYDYETHQGAFKRKEDLERTAIQYMKKMLAIDKFDAPSYKKMVEVYEDVAAATEAGDEDQLRYVVNTQMGRGDIFTLYDEFLDKAAEVDGAYKERLRKAREALDASFDPDIEFRKIDGGHGPEEAGRKADVNPYGLEENCQRCAMAQEFRRRGYDVQVSPGEKDELAYRDRIIQCFKDPEIVKHNSLDTSSHVEAIKKQMAEWGDGARAMLMMYWKGQGHIANIETVGNTIRFTDAQTDTVHTIDLTTGKGTVRDMGGETVEYDAETAKTAVDFEIGVGEIVSTWLMRVDNAEYDQSISDYIMERET